VTLFCRLGTYRTFFWYRLVGVQTLWKDA